MKRKLLSFVLMMICIASCAGGPSEIGATNIPSKVISTQYISATVMPSPIIISTSTLLPSKTLLPLSTPATITTTPLPTLTTEAKEKKFQEIIDGQANCRWPCLVNITPGVTSWEESINTLGKFVQWESKSSSNLKSWSFKFAGEEGWYNGYILQDNSGILSKIRISTTLPTNILRVSEVLRIYGKPSEIYLSPTYASPKIAGLLQLILVYRDQRAILYYEWTEKRFGDNILANDPTPNHKSLMEFVILGNEDFSWTSQDIANAVITYDTKPTLIPLTEITNMTVEQFTSIYSLPNSDHPIVIPISAINH